MATELQPGDNAVKLSKPFFDKIKRLVDYENFPSDPRRRWAVVIVFNMSQAASVVTLDRHETPLITGATASIHIGSSGTGLTHQRADAFRPSRDVEWSLHAGQDVYHFWVERP